MSPKHLLVAVAVDPDDDRLLAQHLVDEACVYAAHLGARVTLLHVEVPHVPAVPVTFDAPAALLEATVALQRARRKAADATLHELQKRAEARGVPVSSRTVDTFGGVGEAIVEGAKGVDADLVVLCSHGRRGIKRLLLGSVADRVLHVSPLPVLVLPPPAA